MRVRSEVVRVGTWTLLFLAAGFAGRATIIDASALSLVWPAAGIAALWFATGNRRQRPWDVLCLGSATFVVNLVTGAPPALAVVFVVTNVVQVSLYTALMRRLAPGVWGSGGTQPLSRLEDLMALMAAAALASVVGAGLGVLGMHAAVGSAGVTSFLVWWGRNAAGLIVVATLGLLLLPRLRGVTGPREAWARIHGEVLPRSQHAVAEAVALTGFTVLVVYLVFVRAGHTPVVFVALFTTVLVGVRTRPVGVALHGLATGGATVALTLAGFGPLAAIDDLPTRALVAQLYVILIVVTGLVLSCSQEQLRTLTHRLRASERAAADRAALFEAVLENMREGVVVVDDTGRVLIRNPHGGELLGLQGDQSDQVKAPQAYGLFNADGTTMTAEQMPFRRAMEGEDVLREDYRMQTADHPAGRILEITATRFRAAPDEHEATGTTPDAATVESLRPELRMKALPGFADTTRPRAIVTFRDVTAERAHRDSLAAFAGVVAHDLLNPLTAVKGWAEALDQAFEHGPVPAEEGLPLLRHVQRAATHMDHFITDLLSYTLSRDAVLAPVDVDITNLARDIANLRCQGDTRPRIEVAEGLRAHADPMLTRQLLDNLIGNAVKYVGPGVRPHVCIAGEYHDGWVHVTVTDNGIGVPLAQRDRIFDDFHRAHPTDYRGTGIGLAICRQVVARHGGHITVHDNPAGHGSVFTFALPAVTVGLTTVPPGAAAALIA